MLIAEEFGFLGTIVFFVILASTIRTLLRLKAHNKKGEFIAWLKILIVSVALYIITIILLAPLFD